MRICGFLRDCRRLHYRLSIHWLQSTGVLTFLWLVAAPAMPCWRSLAIPLSIRFPNRRSRPVCSVVSVGISIVATMHPCIHPRTKRWTMRCAALVFDRGIPTWPTRLRAANNCHRHWWPMATVFDRIQVRPTNSIVVPIPMNSTLNIRWDLSRGISESRPNISTDRAMWMYSLAYRCWAAHFPLDSSHLNADPLLFRSVLATPNSHFLLLVRFHAIIFYL